MKLIGDRSRLAIELHPLAPTWESRYLPERTGWAQLSIWANGRNLCRNVLDGSPSIREGVNVPLGRLADWIVRSWTFIRFEERPDRFPPRASARDTLRKWGNAPPPGQCDEDEWFDARERWWTRHYLAAGADGAQLPNVALLRAGDRLFVEWAPAEFAGARAPWFITEPGQESVSWDRGEAVFAEFVAFMAGWFRKEGLDGVFSWVGLEDPLREAEADFGERLRAFTGIGAEALRGWTASTTDAELRRRLGLPEGSDDPSESVITQVLRDLPPATLESLGREIRGLDERTRKVTSFDEEARAAARDAAKAGAGPEESGRLAAQGIRDRLGLNGEPVADMRERMRTFGVEVVRSGVDCSQERMLVGSRRGAGAAAVINRTPRTATPWGERFELARALGHLLVDSYRADALGAASTPFAQPWARRCSGAFAAEFLLPSDHLYERFGALDSAADRDSFPSLLNDYGVGARTAAFQLWNQELLSSSQVRDDLIDDFSRLEQ